MNRFTNNMSWRDLIEALHALGLELQSLEYLQSIFRPDVAITAKEFESAKSVTLTGDVTGTASSKAGWTIATTLKDSGVKAGKVGSYLDAEPYYSERFTIPNFTVDAKGRVTEVRETYVAMPPEIHDATKMVVGSSSSKTHAATTNGNTFINIFDTHMYQDGTIEDQARSTIGISGSGATSVASTAAGSIVISSTDTNTMMIQNLSTANNTYPVLLVGTANAAGNLGAKTAIFGSGVKVNPSKSAVSATTFIGELEGNAATATILQTTRTINSTDFNGSADITTATWGTARNITIKDADNINAGVTVSVNGSKAYVFNLPSTIKASLTGNASTATTLQTKRKINDTEFDGSAAITTAKWGTARNIYISDADATNTGAAVGVSGATNATLKLPATIKATLTGNAATATKFASAQKVELTGDVLGSVTSQAGWSVATTLKDSGVTAGSYGPSKDVSPTYSKTFSVPYITVDAAGRVTAASTKTITMPTEVHWTTKAVLGASGSTTNAATTNGNTYFSLFDDNSSRASFNLVGAGATTVASDANGKLTITSTDTNTLMTQSVSTANNNYPILLVTSANATANLGAKTAIFGSGVKVNPSTSTITATTVNAALTSLPKGTTYVSGVTQGQALVNATTTGYGAIWNAPTKNYRVGCSTYPSNTDVVYICYSVTNANVTAGTNTTAKTLTWDANTGVLNASGGFGGNAATATQFSADKSVTLTGDVTGTVASKAGWSIATTLANSGVTAGSYGPSANAEPGYDVKFNVPYLTIDAKGRVTAASTKTIKMPADSHWTTKAIIGASDSTTNAATTSGNTFLKIFDNSTVRASFNIVGSGATIVTSGADGTLKISSDNNLMTQSVSTANNTYPILLVTAANATANRGASTAIFGSGVKVNPSTSTVVATTFQGALSGNATTASQAYLLRPNNISNGGYSDALVVSAADKSTSGSANRVSTIRVTNGDGYNEVLLGVHDEANSAPGGITVRNTNGTYTVSLPGTTTGTFKGNLTGNVTGSLTVPAGGTITVPANATLTGNLNGNAATTTKLATARSLWGNTFDGSTDISGMIRASSGVNLYKSSLRMTVNKSSTDTTDYAIDVLKALGDNAGYGVNLCLCGGGNTIVGGGEAGNSQLNDLKDNSEENLYLVSDGAIYFKVYGNTWANARTVTLDTGPNLSGLSSVTATKFIGALEGNAATATKLATTCSLWGNNFNGTANLTSTITVSGNANQFIASQGGYHFLIRNDGNDTYFLISAKDGTAGTWTSARPITIANSTGICNINGNAATATKATQDGSGNTITSTYVNLSGAQTITACKTFKLNNQYIRPQYTDVTKGTNPSSTHWSYQEYLDSAGTRLGWIGHSYTNAGDTSLRMEIVKQDATTAASMGIGYNSSKVAYTWAPHPPAANSSAQIATTAWIMDAANRRQCLVGQSSSTATNPWYKFASFAATVANDDPQITFYVEQTYSSRACGILRCHVRLDGSIVYNSCNFDFLANTGLDPAKFMLVIGTAAKPTIELWVKIDTAWLYYRFIVISEGKRTSNGNVWTLYNASSAGQAANPTSGTQVTATIRSVSNKAVTLAWNTNSTIATVNGTDITVKLPANPDTNTTYSAGAGLALSSTTFSVQYLPSTTTVNRATGLAYTSGQIAIGSAAGNSYKGSSNNAALISGPADGTVWSTTIGNIQNLRLSWGSDGKYFTDIFASPNNHCLWHRDIMNGTAYGWRRLVEENVTGITAPSWNISIAGNAANVTGTVAIDHGGTGATTRLAAVKNLTNENVGTSAQHFLTITDNWGKAGYTTVTNAKTVLGLGTAAYTNSTAYAAASHTHSYLPLSGGTVAGQVTINRANGGAGGGLRFIGDGQNYAISIQDSGCTKATAPKAIRYLGIDFYGSNYTDWTNRIALLNVEYNTDKRTTCAIVAYSAVDAKNTTTCSISANVDGSGNPYTAAPTPAAADNSTKIATTAWVRAATGNTSLNAATATTASKLGTATVGSSTRPIYLNAGAATQCSTSLGVSITGNAATATTASKLGTATVGSSTLPIYLNAGAATACSTSLAVSITGNAATASQAAILRPGNLANETYSDVLVVSASDKSTNGTANRVGTIRVTNGKDYNKILIGVHNEANGAPGGITVQNENGKFTVGLPGTTTGTFSGNLTGNADTATTATKLGTATVGGSATPIYLNKGTPTACGYSFSSYLPLSGGTVTGALTLSRTTDASGTADNSPALRIGKITETHLELDGNEIMAKASGTTVGTLYINSDGGLVQIGSGGLKVTGTITGDVTGCITKNPGTGSYVNSVKLGAAIVNSSANSFGTIWNAPTKNYRVGCATWPDNNDNVIWYSITNTNVKNSTNTTKAIMTWSAADGTLTAAAFAGNASSATKLATKRSLWGNNFDGTAAISGIITGAPAIELFGGAKSNNGGYIDFHYNNNSADYTSRIIESASGVLSIGTFTGDHTSGTVQCEMHMTTSGSANKFPIVVTHTNLQSNQTRVYCSSVEFGMAETDANGAALKDSTAAHTDRTFLRKKWDGDFIINAGNKKLIANCGHFELKCDNGNAAAYGFIYAGVAESSSMSGVNCEWSICGNNGDGSTNNKSNKKLGGFHVYAKNAIRRASLLVKEHTHSSNNYADARDYKLELQYSANLTNDSATTVDVILRNGYITGWDSSGNATGSAGRPGKICSEKNNTVSLGDSSQKWTTVYATTGTIATSDIRLKDQIATFPDEVLDAWEDVEWKQYKFKDSIKEKGIETARTHAGVIAQEVQEAFLSHDLDPTKYSFFCYDSWEAVEDEVDKDTGYIRFGQEAGDVYSIRYEEALCIEAAYQRRRTTKAEARITALEEENKDLKDRLSKLETLVATLVNQ